MNLEELYKLADDINGTVLSPHRKGVKIEEWFNSAMSIETDLCILWKFAKTKGYGHIGGSIKLVHMKAAHVKFGPKPDGMDTAHGQCHDKACFNYRHLSYKTRSENNFDRRRDGTDLRGEKGPAAKLSDQQIENIRIAARLVTGITQRDIARLYGISESHISSVLNNKDRAS